MMRTRRLFQIGFLILTLSAVFLVQGNAELWCPFGGVETLYSYVTGGNLLCSLGVSNLYVLAGVIVLTLLLRRAFCGYVCPVGAVSEGMRAIGSRLGLRTKSVPHRLDQVLSLLKYVVLGLILYFTLQDGELVFRRVDPCYALISRHGEDITFWAYGILGTILLGSLLISLPFCRWLCPLAAVLNLFSRWGLTRITRHSATCVDCGKCAQACPMAIPVNAVPSVTHARCLSCLSCVDACLARSRSALTWGPMSKTWPKMMAAVSIVLIFAATAAAVYAFPLPSFVWARGTASAQVEALDLKLRNLTCRGRGTLLVYYLERDDELALSGYLKVEAWPGPATADLRITFDPQEITPDDIRQAIVEPYFDADARKWQRSPFEILNNETGCPDSRVPIE